MRAAGIHRYRGPVELLELPVPGELRREEVLVEVRCGGGGNWDEIARADGWDLGRHPPMALGVEAARVAAGTGGAVASVAAGDRVMTHSLPLRAEGAWAEWLVAYAPSLPRVLSSVYRRGAGATLIDRVIFVQALAEQVWQTDEALYRIWETVRPATSGETCAPYPKAMNSVLGLERPVNVSAGRNRWCAAERLSPPGTRCRPPRSSKMPRPGCGQGGQAASRLSSASSGPGKRDRFAEMEPSWSSPTSPS